jgi:hypothetical protein
MRLGGFSEGIAVPDHQEVEGGKKGERGICGVRKPAAHDLSASGARISKYPRMSGPVERPFKLIIIITIPTSMRPLCHIGNVLCLSWS